MVYVNIMVIIVQLKLPMYVDACIHVRVQCKMVSCNRVIEVGFYSKVNADNLSVF